MFEDAGNLTEKVASTASISYIIFRFSFFGRYRDVPVK